MISIQSMGRIDKPKIAETNKDVFKYPSGHWELYFHDPNEWHYGSYGWQLSLSHDGLDVTSEHRELQRSGRAKGFVITGMDQPWLSNGKSFVVNNGQSVFLYNVENKKTQIITNDGFPYLILCSPERNQFLLSKFTEARILDEELHLEVTIKWERASSETPQLFWMDSSHFIAHMWRKSRSSKTRLTLFSSETGEIVDSIIIDPIDLAPYQCEIYKTINRNSASLETSYSSWAQGYLLDIWGEVIFDQHNNTLFLSCYRPVSEIFRKRGTNMCKVEEVWVAIRVNLS